MRAMEIDDTSRETVMEANETLENILRSFQENPNNFKGNSPVKIFKLAIEQKLPEQLTEIELEMVIKIQRDCIDQLSGNMFFLEKEIEKRWVLTKLRQKMKVYQKK